MHRADLQPNGETAMRPIAQYYYCSEAMNCSLTQSFRSPFVNRNFACHETRTLAAGPKLLTDSRVMVDPVEDLRVPDETVFSVQNPICNSCQHQQFT